MAASLIPDDLPAHTVHDDSWTNLYLGDVAVVDLATGLVARVGPGTKALGYAFSPDGRRVLYTDLRWQTGNDGAGSEPRYDMILADRRAGTHRATVAWRLRDFGLTMSWDPFGRQVAYADSAGGVSVIGTD